MLVNNGALMCAPSRAQNPLLFSIEESGEGGKRRDVDQAHLFREHRRRPSCVNFVEHWEQEFVHRNVHPRKWIDRSRFGLRLR